MPKKSDFGTEAVLKKVYPLVERAMDTRKPQWMKVMSSFMAKRQTSLFDIAPCDRIYYNDNDREELFTALNLSMSEIRTYLRDTYYWSIEKFKPSAAKDEATIVCICMVRYFLLKNQPKELELALIYQAFSGKYYPSIHYGFFKMVAPAKYRHIMEYVVNHKLNQKFDLKSKGSVIGAIKSVNSTWVTAYAKQLKHFDDEDICYIIQQLHNRIKSFMKNIASLYYEAYENKEYITYDKDSLPEEGDNALYHLATNDSFRMNQYVERTMEKLNTSQIDYGTCKACADANVKTDEVKGILEAIMYNKENLKLIREYLTLTIAVYLSESPVKEINSVKFLFFCKKAKPNTKDPALIRLKEITEKLLDDNSVGYRKRKHRVATKQSYHNALAMYLAMMAIKANQ